MDSYHYELRLHFLGSDIWFRWLLRQCQSVTGLVPAAIMVGDPIHRGVLSSHIFIISAAATAVILGVGGTTRTKSVGESKNCGTFMYPRTDND